MRFTVVAAFLALCAVNVYAEIGAHSQRRQSTDNSVTDKTVTLRSDVHEDKFPENLPMTLQLEDGEPINMNLELNKRMNPKYVTVNFDGNPHKIPADDRLHHVALYHDEDSKGTFMVTAHSDGEGAYTHSAEGVMLLDGDSHNIQKSEDGVLRARRSILNMPQQDETAQLTKRSADFSFSDPHISNLQYSFSNGDFHLSFMERPNFNHGHRFKRQANVPTDFDIEIMMVVDHTVYDHWLNKRRNHNDAMSEIVYLYTQYFSTTERCYASIDQRVHNVRITPRLYSIEVLSRSNSTLTRNAITQTRRPNPTDPYDQFVNTDTYFELAAQWKENNNLDWKTPDHLMTFTLYNVKNDNVLGVALMDQICNGHNSIGFKGGLSIVGDHGLSTWRTITHELAHNLGAEHDGGNCPANLNYIMNPVAAAITAASVDNAHEFSVCSINMMKANLQGTCTDNFCNVKTCTIDYEYTELAQQEIDLLGETYSKNEQCEMKHGAGATFYSRFNTDICYDMRCLKPDGFIYNGLSAADGTACGRRGRGMCYEGHCVRRRKIQEVSRARRTPTCSAPPPGCTDDNQFSGIFNNERVTCNDVATKLPSLCWLYGTYRNSCPATCHRVFCDTESQSPCPSTGGQTCQDNPMASFNGENCAQFCGSIRNLPTFADIKRRYPILCQHCCRSCGC